MVPSARARAYAALTERKMPLSLEETEVLREVFGEVVRAHHADVWEQVRRRCLSPEDADEIVQDAFVAVFRWIVANGFPASLGGLVHALTKGVLVNYLRKRGTTPMSVALPSSTSEKPRSSSRVDTERRVVLREIAARLFAQLPQDQQAAVEKVILQGFSYAEAAADLGIAVGTCKSRVRYAKHALYVLAVEMLPPSQQGVA